VLVRQQVVSTISRTLDKARDRFIYTLVGHEIHKSRQNAPLSDDPVLLSNIHDIGCDSTWILLQKFSRLRFIIASIVTT
jgi:hypothetical protein